MFLLSFLVITLGVVSPTCGNNRFCRRIQRMDCAVGFVPNVICGNDGVTYQNDCEFSKELCKNPNLKQDYNGACTISTKPLSTTPEPTTVFTTPEPTTVFITPEPTTVFTTPEPTTVFTTTMETSSAPTTIEPSTVPTSTTEPTTTPTPTTEEPTTEDSNEELTSQKSVTPATEMVTSENTSTFNPIKKKVLCTWIRSEEFICDPSRHKDCGKDHQIYKKREMKLRLKCAYKNKQLRVAFKEQKIISDSVESDS